MTPSQRQRIQTRLSSDEIQWLREMRAGGVRTPSPVTEKLSRKGYARPAPTCLSHFEITDAGREVVG